MGVVEGALVVAAAAAVIGAGVSIYQATRGTPSIRPQTPAGSIDYVTGYRQRWDRATNSYIYEKIPDSQLSPEALEERKKAEAEEAKKKKIRDQYLGYLDKDPDAWLEAGEKIKQAYTEAISEDVEEKWEESRKWEEEQAEKKGLTGSKSYADIMAEMEEDKLKTEQNIAQQAELLKESKLQSEREFAAGLVGQLDTGLSADAALALKKQQLAGESAQTATAAQYAKAMAEYQGDLQKWQQRQQLGKTLMDTGAGLAFLYGYTGGGNTTLGKNYLVPGGGANVSNYYGTLSKGLRF
jgi:hypothetical protein